MPPNKLSPVSGGGGGGQETNNNSLVSMTTPPHHGYERSCYQATGSGHGGGYPDLQPGLRLLFSLHSQIKTFT